MMKPKICITMGDPAGVGSEIIAKVLNRPDVYSKCNPLVIGDKQAMTGAVTISNVNLEIHTIDNVKDAVFKHGVIDVYDLHNVDMTKLTYGKVSRECGKAAGQYIEKAINLALKKEVDAVVLGSEKDFMDPIDVIKPDIIALGYDQFHQEEKLHKTLVSRGYAHTKLIRLKKHVVGRSTSKIVQDIIKHSYRNQKNK